MPVNLAARPLGRVACRELSACSPSLRSRRRTKGLRAPALELSLPALKPGANGRWPGALTQPLPPGPEPMSKLAVGLAFGVPGVDQGTKLVVVSKLPQVTGLASGARGPVFRLTVKWLAGSCGFSVKTVVSWPVSLSATAVPGSLKLIP